MTPIFADTAFYVAIVNPRDQLFGKAQALAGMITGPIITTDFKLVETASFLCRGSKSRNAFTQLFQALHHSPGIEVVPASRDLLDRAYALFVNRPDKDWSLTDCTSFVVMQDRNLTDALTSDRHFEQAGFRVLMA
jgi:predicted nucleic acid-binding protein